MGLIGSMRPGLEMGGRQTLNELGEINTLLFTFVFCVAFIILRAKIKCWPILATNTANERAYKGGL